MDGLLIALEGAVVILAIFMGVRQGGIGLGVWGLVGLFVLVFVFQLNPGSPPTDAVFIVITVITAASVMQAAGGIDWMVGVAARAIETHPERVTYYAPFLAFFFTVGAGTGNIYYPLLPVIYESAYSKKIRPERPLAAAALASQVGIICSPVSAATASLTALLEPSGFSLGKILLIMWPASVVALLVVAAVQNRRGKELVDDPVYQDRLGKGLLQEPQAVDVDKMLALPPEAKRSAIIFLAGVGVIVLFGLFGGLRPTVGTGDAAAQVSVTTTIQLVMGVVAGLIFLTCRVKAADVPKQSTFGAGVVGAIALFGIAWMANTFIAAHEDVIVDVLGDAVEQASWLFGVALFVVAALTTSQSTATNAIVPIGLSLGLTAGTITAFWPSVTGIYFLPANGSQVATVAFDQTGTTKIGKAVLNHSFMIPLLIFTAVSVAVALPISALVG
ncbi:MAG: anaerobic C4-dicarboxylate transporter family protein [Acidimicrobiales bacterium]